MIRFLKELPEEVEIHLIECTKFGFNFDEDLSDEMKGWFLSHGINKWWYNIYTTTLSKKLYDLSHPAYGADF